MDIFLVSFREMFQSTWIGPGTVILFYWFDSFINEGRYYVRKGLPVKNLLSPEKKGILISFSQISAPLINKNLISDESRLPRVKYFTDDISSIYPTV